MACAHMSRNWRPCYFCKLVFRERRNALSRSSFIVIRVSLLVTSDGCSCRYPCRREQKPVRYQVLNVKTTPLPTTSTAHHHDQPCYNKHLVLKEEFRGVVLETTHACAKHARRGWYCCTLVSSPHPPSTGFLVWMEATMLSHQASGSLTVMMTFACGFDCKTSCQTTEITEITTTPREAHKKNVIFEPHGKKLTN